MMPWRQECFKACSLVGKLLILLLRTRGGQTCGLNTELVGTLANHLAGALVIMVGVWAEWRKNEHIVVSKENWTELKEHIRT